MSKLAASAKELKKWSQLLLKIRPRVSFEACTDPRIPDYKTKEAWLSHPNIESKVLLRPSGLDEKIIEEVPTFFIHPTSFFGNDNWNADINELKSRQLLEELSIPAQASVFNHLGPVYVPIYRQATFYAFITGSIDALAALDLAYQDVLRAFNQFLAEVGERPFFIAGHSQGSLLGMRLLADEIEPNPSRTKRLVAAYLPGYKFPQQKFDKEFTHIKKGEKPDQVHCVLAWDTFLQGFNALHYIDNANTWIKEDTQWKWKKRMTFLPFCVNPVTWDTDIPASNIDQNLGAVINEYTREPFQWIEVGDEEAPGIVTHSLSKPVANLVSAKVGLGNLLYVSKPKGMIFNIGKMPVGNYHVYDYTFFYMDIRTNASLRWEKYKSLYLDL